MTTSLRCAVLVFQNLIWPGSRPCHVISPEIRFVFLVVLSTDCLGAAEVESSLQILADLALSSNRARSMIELLEGTLHESQQRLTFFSRFELLLSSILQQIESYKTTKRAFCENYHSLIRLPARECLSTTKAIAQSWKILLACPPGSPHLLSFPISHSVCECSYRGYRQCTNCVPSFLV